MKGMVGQPIIFRELEAQTSIDRVKNRILDLQDNANNSMQILLEMQMYNKYNIQYEKKFLCSVIGFAFEVKSKMRTLSQFKNLESEERKNIQKYINAISYYVRHFRELDIDSGVELLDILNDTCDSLGISSIVKATPRTFTTSDNPMMP